MSDDVPAPRSETGGASVPPTGSEGPSARQGRRKRKQLNPIVELVGLVAIALLLALGIQALLVKPYRIPSESMEPLLVTGQRVLVNRLSHHLGSDPSVGDVVVFHPPKGANAEASGLQGQEEGSGECGDQDNIAQGRPCSQSIGGEWKSENYIKRVVAGPGDRVSVRDGHVVLNGKQQTEKFISDTCDGAGTTDTPCSLPRTITVPAGHYYMMGDNRGESNDSRFWGPVPRDWVIGGAFATYWPPKRIGGI
ncbi:signal peptidase I [Patulibacter sp.]|uniref:signal peptidase I n=1 Tax=Patulibacter sp. TaxID=1912859 RepID=UPI002717BA07|nr:signal peptidase I [Patulibacter sp.]MDO9410918.1 signal peptidase I [Patulibacter sp.]